MLSIAKAVLLSVLLASYATAAPAPALSSVPIASSSSSTAAADDSSTAVSSSTVVGSESASAASATPTVPYASDDPNYWLWNSTETTSDPQPQRGTLGGNIMGPQNVEMDRQNPDILAPPTTDSGTVYVAATYDCECCC